MNGNTAPIVISYLRFSSPEQLKGDSVRRQLALGEEWANRHGMVIANTVRDLGVSAFRGKNAAEGNLSRFLSLVDDGKIPRGSVLLVEQLDRLSRSSLLTALELFLSIIRRGIKIVTLMDRQEYDSESLNKNMMGLQYSIMQMSLAHEESAKKSERLAHAWTGKRLQMADTPLTRQLPAWMKVEGGKIVLNEEKARIVRRMISLALEGFGLEAITKKINTEFDGLGRRDYVPRSYTAKILTNRALIGEFQPHRLTYASGKKRREPIGEPLLNYYPALIDGDTFYAIRSKFEGRRQTGGRQNHYTNLFLGCLYDRNDGSTLVINDKGWGKRYVSSAALTGTKGASPFVGFPVEVMERAVLLQLHDVILPHMTKDDTTEDRRKVEAMEARIAEIDRKIEAAQEATLNLDGVNVASVIALMVKMDGQKKKMLGSLNEMRGEIAAKSTTDLDVARTRLAEIVSYFKSGTAKLNEDQRVELRNVIATTIDRIEATVKRTGRDYSADVAINLRDGSSLAFQIFAKYEVTMKRDAKGHPQEGGTAGPPQYRLGLSNNRWTVIPSGDRTKYLVAEVGGKRHYEVPAV